jgi:two-component system phosphate regulon response regulator PhoB
LNDIPDFLELCHFLLEREGYQHLYTTNADKALSILQQEPIDLFIQDIVRPTMNGFELYWLMKSKRELRDIPILIVSAWHPVVVTPLDLAGKAMEGLRCVEFKVTHPEHRRALSAVAGITKANVLYVEGYIRPQDFPKELLSTVREILQKRRLLSLTEEERASRHEQFVATQEVDFSDESLAVLSQWDKSIQARLRNKLAHSGD